METEVKAAMTITAIGMIDYMQKMKDAIKDGWKPLGDPDVVGKYIYQTVTK